MIDMSEMSPFMPLMRHHLQAKAWRSAEGALPQRWHRLLAQRGVEGTLEHAGADGADGAIGSTSGYQCKGDRRDTLC